MLTSATKIVNSLNNRDDIDAPVVLGSASTERSGPNSGLALMEKVNVKPVLTKFLGKHDIQQATQIPNV